MIDRLIEELTKGATILEVSGAKGGVRIILEREGRLTLVVPVEPLVRALAMAAAQVFLNCVTTQIRIGCFVLLVVAALIQRMVSSRSTVSLKHPLFQLVEAAERLV